MRRKILIALAVAVVLVITGVGVASYWAKELSTFALVPAKRFTMPRRLQGDAYDHTAFWYSQGAGHALDPSRWQPSGADAPAPLEAAVFFIHPTSSFERSHWNTPLEDIGANAYAQTFLRGLATPFAGAREIWAPRYRQATFGAFLTDGPEGEAALAAAYRDVLMAFDAFIRHADPARPIILAGHSQGAYHLLRLLRDRVAGQDPAHQAVAKRIVAAYVVGWPVSLAHDLPALGLPACTTANQTGCILSWQSFAAPADTTTVREAYARLTRLDGRKGGGTPFLCVNPLTGTQGATAPASANAGTLVPDMTLTGASVVKGLTGASCSPDGFLLLDHAPRMGALVMPGGNYHVYDIPLFWSAVRADALRRTAAYHAKPAR